MGDYKLLNSELIDANRELKQTLAVLQKELVLMRSDLIDQHRMRVEAERDYRESLLSLCTQNFLTFIRKIDENVNVLDLLSHNNSALSGTSHASIRGQSDSTRRRSTQLTKDFRRSSAVCRQQSVVHMSPTRRQRQDNAIEEENEPGTMGEKESQSGSDMELDNSINEGNVIDVENDETLENADLRCIREDSEEEDQTEKCEENNETHKGAEIQGSPRHPIRDVTNLDMAHRNPKVCVATRRGTEQRLCSDSENSIELAREVEQDNRQTTSNYLSRIDVEDDLANSLHCTLHVSRSASDLREANQNRNGQNNNFHNQNFNRHLTVRVQRLHEAPKLAVHFDNEASEENSSVNIRKNDGEQQYDPFLGVTALSIGDFQELCSSTPCHNRERSDSENKTDETIHSYSFSSTCSSMRPSRRCAPKTLVEPSLKDKLRSNSGKRKPPRKR